MKTVRITVLVENMARGRRVLGEHGLAFFIEIGDRRILFDTGQGKVIGHNAEVLGVDLEKVDAVVLSHGHYDHTGGFASLPASDRPRRVFLHPSAVGTKYSRHADGFVHDIGLPEAARAALEGRSTERVWVREPTEILDQVLATGEIPRQTDCEDVGGAFYTDRACTQPDLLPDDQALALRTPEGIVVLLGCAHAGVVNTLDHIARVLGEGQFHAVVGGMHLMRASWKRLRATADALDRYGVRLIMPCHCTGVAATAWLWQHAKERCRECAAGTVIEFG